MHKGPLLAAGMWLATLFSHSSPTFATAAAPTIVEMRSINFAPRRLVISKGTSVVWKNTSRTGHSATANESGSFDTGIVEPGTESKPVTFDHPGQYTYHCAMHGLTMSGMIVVND